MEEHYEIRKKGKNRARNLCFCGNKKCSARGSSRYNVKESRSLLRAVVQGKKVNFEPAGSRFSYVNNPDFKGRATSLHGLSKWKRVMRQREMDAFY